MGRRSPSSYIGEGVQMLSIVCSCNQPHSMTSSSCLSSIQSHGGPSSYCWFAYMRKVGSNGADQRLPVACMWSAKHDLHVGTTVTSPSTFWACAAMWKVKINGSSMKLQIVFRTTHAGQAGHRSARDKIAQQQSQQLQMNRRYILKFRIQSLTLERLFERLTSIRLSLDNLLRRLANCL